MTLICFGEFAILIVLLYQINKLDILSIAFAGDRFRFLHYVLSGCESLKMLEIRDYPFGDKALLANLDKLETMFPLDVSMCS